MELSTHWLNHLIDGISAEFKLKAGKRMSALYLTGSCARGEAAFQSSGAERRLACDIDLAVVGGGRHLKRACRELHRFAQAEHGVALDILGPVTRRSLKRAMPELSWYSLAMGHSCLAGDAYALAEYLPLDVYRAPLREEAARLLLKAGSFLLRGLRALDGLDVIAEPGFAGRMRRSWALAAGDALLVLHHRFVLPVAERPKAYKALEDAKPEIKAMRFAQAYESACAEKLSPRDPGDDEPSRSVFESAIAQWGSIFLYAANELSGGCYRNFNEFIAKAPVMEPEKNGMRDRLKRMLRGRLNGSNPREELYRQIGDLLGLAGKPAKGQVWAREGSAFLAKYRSVR
jgi:hypothetical protein